MSLIKLLSWIAEQNLSQNPFELMTSPLNLEISSLGNFAFKLEMETWSRNGLEDGKLSQSTWILGLNKQCSMRVIRTS